MYPFYRRKKESLLPNTLKLKSTMQYMIPIPQVTTLVTNSPEIAECTFVDSLFTPSESCCINVRADSFLCLAPTTKLTLSDLDLDRSPVCPSSSPTPKHYDNTIQAPPPNMTHDPPLLYRVRAALSY